MNNYLFLKEEYLKTIFFNGFISDKSNHEFGIYNKLVESNEKVEPYFITRPSLEKYLNVDNSVNIRFSNWYYINSNNFKGIKKHRIYLHLDGKYIPYVAKKFIEKCKLKNIQFWFKFQFNHNRSDSMVFYPTDEQFPIFNSILNEIMEENKIIKNNLLTPPISSIIYNDKFGYGKEFEDGKSWSENISNMLLLSSNHVLYKYASLIDYSKYTIDDLSKKFSEAFYNDYENYLYEYKIKDNIFEDNNEIKKEFENKVKLFLPKIFIYVKNYDKLSKYINSNAIISEFYIGNNKFILRMSTLIVFMKYFIKDIVEQFGEDRIINTLKSFVELNIYNNDKIFDISNSLLKLPN